MTRTIGVTQLGPALDVCTDTQEIGLGTVIEGEGGNRYRYVRFVDAVAYKKTDVVTIAGTTWQVTKDRAGGSAVAGLQPVGVVFQDTPPTQNQYGWVQISGVASVTAGSASIVAGDYLKPDASEDGDADEATVGTDANIVGVALATIADNAAGNVLLTIAGV